MLCSLSACQEEDGFGNSYSPSLQKKSVSVILEVSTNSLSFGVSGGSESVSITSNTSWTVTSSESWCAVSTSTGSGNGTVSISVTANTSASSRTATVTFTSGNVKREVKVTQDAPTLSISPNTLSFDASGGSKSVSVTSNTSWTVTSSETWCTVSSSSGSGNGTVSISVTANTSTSSRTAKLTFTSGDIRREVSVTQKGTSGTVSGDDAVSYTVTGNGKTVTFKMIRVEAGTFQMGSDASDAYSDEQPVHTVTLTKDYYMGETEVTQALWYAVMGQKPTSGGSQWSSAYGLGDSYPAYYISWEDCQEFITKLNTLTGQTFRMPTEAEWEFAAKGGNSSMGYTYSGSNTIGDVAWYTDNSGSTTHTVKTKQANELGIYDMSGNVWEWCSDWYGSYSSSAQTNPTGPTSGSYRVNRGGCWIYGARFCRSSCRNYGTPGYSGGNLGLRLAL